MTTPRPTAYTHVERPTRVEAADLDRWLGEGYFRMRQSMFSARFVHFEGNLRSTIWTRLPLAGHRFRPSLERRIRRNDRRFRLNVGAFVADELHEGLYGRYLLAARGDRSPTLLDALRADSDADAFQTRVLDVWDGDRLVAFSLFDEGHTSIQSVLGVYDPDYASRSLGLYTMCKEIEYGRDAGFAYHYAGYVLPGVAAMDYKHDVGPLEAWDHDQRRWLPFAERLRKGLDSDHMLYALVQAQEVLRVAGITTLLHSYPEFEGPAWSPELASCLDQPMYLECPQPGWSARRLIIWDLVNQRFELCHAVGAVGTFVPRGRPQRSVRLWMLQARAPVEGGLDGLVAAVQGPLPSKSL